MAGKNLDKKDEKSMGEKPVDEKDEKELLKHDEKIEGRDQLSAIVWAAILIWTGLVFLAVNTGWLDNFLAAGFFAKYLPKGMAVFEPAVWGLVMFGAGVILLFGALTRLLLPQFRKRLGGTLVVAAVFISIGVGNFLGRWEIIWPLLLIALGASILFGGLRSKPK